MHMPTHSKLKGEASEERVYAELLSIAKGYCVELNDAWRAKGGDRSFIDYVERVIERAELSKGGKPYERRTAP